MNRPVLFYGSLALFGVVSLAEGVLQALESGITLSTGGIVVASLLILGPGLYGLVRPEAREDTADSWLAYLVAVGALLTIVSIAAGRP